jgi:hypothetical protein
MIQPLCKASQARNRRKIRLIEGDAKCLHLKNLPVNGLCGRCLSIWGPEPPFPLRNVQYTWILYSIHTGKGGGRVEPERRLEKQQFTKLRRKYEHDWPYLINACRKVPLLANFFKWRHFALVSTKLISPCWELSERRWIKEQSHEI